MFEYAKEIIRSKSDKDMQCKGQLFENSIGVTKSRKSKNIQCKEQTFEDAKGVITNSNLNRQYNG